MRACVCVRAYIKDKCVSRSARQTGVVQVGAVQHTWMSFSMSTLQRSVWYWYSPGVLNVPTGRATCVTCHVAEHAHARCGPQKQPYALVCTLEGSCPDPWLPLFTAQCARATVHVPVVRTTPGNSVSIAR